jgi:hypothetical protein
LHPDGPGKLTTLGLRPPCADFPIGRGAGTSGFGKEVVAEPSESCILDGRKKRQGDAFEASPRFVNDCDRWSVAVRMPKTPSHFPSVFHFGADCFGP